MSSSRMLGRMIALLFASALIVGGIQLAISTPPLCGAGFLGFFMVLAGGGIAVRVVDFARSAA